MLAGVDEAFPLCYNTLDVLLPLTAIGKNCGQDNAENMTCTEANLPYIYLRSDYSKFVALLQLPITIKWCGILLFYAALVWETVWGGVM